MINIAKEPGEFAKQKNAMLSFLQGFDYSGLRQQIDAAFSSDEAGDLKKVNARLQSLEDRIKGFDKQDKVRLPFVDEKINTFIARISDIADEFKEQLDARHVSVARRFLEIYNNDVNSADDELLQKKISELRHLSRYHHVLQSIDSTFYRKDMAQYCQFSLSLDWLESQMQKVFESYLKAEDKTDIRDVNLAVSKIKKQLKKTKPKRFWSGVHRAYCYENPDLNALEEELKRDLLPVKKKLQNETANVKKQLLRLIYVANDNLAHLDRLNGFLGSRYDKYAGTMLLSSLVKEYRAVVSDYNNLLKEKKNYARQVYAGNETRRELEQLQHKLKDAERAAAQETRKRTEAEKTAEDERARYERREKEFYDAISKQGEEQKNAEKRIEQKVQEICKRFDSFERAARAKEQEAGYGSWRGPNASFSLPSYLERIKTDDHNVYILIKILNGDKGKRDWIDRIIMYTETVEGFISEKKKADAGVMGVLLEGLEKGLSFGYLAFKLGGSEYKKGLGKKAVETTKRYISELAA